nr:MAG TPA: hypothetical protein [Caudoviricetes sp.]
MQILIKYRKNKIFRIIKRTLISLMLLMFFNLFI